MGRDVIFPVVIAVAVIAMIATLMFGYYRNRNTVSLERAEREGRLGREGLRHAQQRADRDWVENAPPAADTLPVSDVVDHTIADGARSRGAHD